MIFPWLCQSCASNILDYPTEGQYKYEVVKFENWHHTLSDFMARIFKTILTKHFHHKSSLNGLIVNEVAEL